MQGGVTWGGYSDMARAKKRAEKIRLRDVPILAFDGSQRPYFIKEGYLSDIAGFVPTIRGGYRRAPQWIDHYAAATGETLIGASRVGPIATGDTPQITIATAKPSVNAIFQYKVIADGSGSRWGMSFGSLQDYDRRRIVYHRKGGREYTLGWDPDAYGYHCHLFESNYTPLGVEPTDQSGIVLTPVVSGGNMGTGHVRVYLAFRRTPTTYDYGAPDLGNPKDVQLTGTTGRNSIDISSITAAVWPSTSLNSVWRTRVVADAAQLPLEPVYFATVMASDATSVSLTASDAHVTQQPQLELGKFDFPGVGVASQFLEHLHLGEHLGFLAVTGVKYDYRMYFGGYLNTEGAVVQDENWWGFSVDIPTRDTIVSWVSFRGICIALCKNGLYRLRDESANPAYWWWEHMAAIRGEHVSAIAIVNDVVMIVGRGLGGEWNVWASDGINLNPVGNEVSVFLASDVGIVAPDGLPMLIGSTGARNYVMNQQGKWGKNNADTDVAWDVGRDSTFRGGAAMLAGDGGVYYEGSAFSSNTTDRAVTRDFFLDIEERTEWEEVFVLATKAGLNASVTVQGRVDGGGVWITMATITVDATSGGRYRVPIPPGIRQGYRFQVRLSAADANQFTIEGVIVQARPTPAMT